MTLEQCAQRMTAFLDQKPRSAKTRAYVATLPKAPHRVVTPAEYLTKTQAAAEGRSAERDAARLAAWEARGKPPSPTMPRRRLRPRASIERHEQRLIDRIAEHQLYRCLLCGGPLDFASGFEPHDDRRPSFDHVLPKSLGGKNDGNLLIAHRKCNSDKSNRRPTGCELVWLAAVNARLSLLQGEA